MKEEVGYLHFAFLRSIDNIISQVIRVYAFRTWF